MQVIKPRLMPQLAEPYEFPLTHDELVSHFGDILPASKLSVTNGCFPNTSDVLIAYATWDSGVDSWTLMVIAAARNNVERVHQLLIEEGLLKVKDWFVSTDEELHQHPEKWSYPGLTLRFEDDKLTYTQRSGVRPGRRPPPNWYSQT